MYYEKLGRMLKPLLPKFRSDLFVRLTDIAEKQVPAKLKPVVGDRTAHSRMLAQYIEHTILCSLYFALIFFVYCLMTISPQTFCNFWYNTSEFSIYIVLSFRCLDQQWCRGGNASNSATVLSLLGADAEFFGSIPHNSLTR